MRSFNNGTFLTDKSGKMPVRNSMRVPLFNNPVPHMMKMLSTEKLFRKFDLSSNQFDHNIKRFSSWRSTNESKPSFANNQHSVLPMA